MKMSIRGKKKLPVQKKLNRFPKTSYIDGWESGGIILQN